MKLSDLTIQVPMDLHTHTPCPCGDGYQVQRVYKHGECLADLVTLCRVCGRRGLISDIYIKGCTFDASVTVFEAQLVDGPEPTTLVGVPTRTFTLETP